MHPRTMHSDSVQIRTQIFLRTKPFRTPYQSSLRPKKKETKMNCSRHVLHTPFTTGKDFRGVAVWLNTIDTTTYYGFLHVREMRDAVDQNAANSLSRTGAEGLPRSWLCMREIYAVQRICMCLRCGCVRGGGYATYRVDCILVYSVA